MKKLIIQADRLIDGRGGAPLEGVAVVMEGDVISDIAPAAQLGDALESWCALRFPGATVLPGLIDAHTHTNMAGRGRSGEEAIADGDDLMLLRSAKNAGIALRSGVTTMCDNGAWHNTGLSLKRGIEEGEVDGPTMLVCGRPVTVTGGHLWFMGGEADGVDGVRKATRRLIKEGADFIKVIATGGSTLTSYPYRPAFGVDELKSIVAEAHNQGKFVGAHCRSNQGMRNVLEAGLDAIYHAFFMDEEERPSYDAEIVERIVQQGVWVNPTMHIGRSSVWALEAKRETEGLSLEEEAKLTAGYEHRKTRVEQVARMVDAGVRLIAGSDCGWGSYPFGQLHYELECMVQGGLSPMQAIVSATSHAAEALGIGDGVGELAPGKRADLLVVEGDPSVEILDLMKVQAVFKGGEQVV